MRASLPRHVFVTGANGFVGTHLRESLAGRGCSVSGVDLVGGPGILSGDTTEPAAWAQHLRGVDVVIHTAAVVTFAGDLERFWHVNVVGTRRVLEAACAAGVPRVVVLSSVVVYGFHGTGVADEDRPVHPTGSPYVDTKIATEQVALQAHASGEVETIVVRPGDVYGPRSPQWVIAPIEELRRGRNLIPAGPGLLNLVYVDDLVEGIVAAASTPSAAGQVLNLTGEPVPTRRYFQRLAELVGTRPPRTLPRTVLRPAAGFMRGLDRARGKDTHLSGFTVDYLARPLTVSNARAREVLSWEPRVHLDEGMGRTAEWLARAGMLDVADGP